MFIRNKVYLCKADDAVITDLCLEFNVHLYFTKYSLHTLGLL